MNTPEKDTIYIDIDDEITAMIDKMQASKSKIVALVLPKRASVLQSIVNMKLLKKAASNANKNIVLITSEASLLPLAGVAGVHVAKNLQSKPEIPPKPSLREIEEELSADVPASSKGETEDVDKRKSVGELATKNSTTPPPEDTIEVDNSAPAGVVAAGAAKAAKKAKKDKKNKIPNFDTFRKRLFIGGAALIALLVFWFFAAFKMPSAKITIKTDASSQAASVNFTASPGAQSVNSETKVIPAKASQSEKSETQKVPATGQKDVGTKATGSVTISNCTDFEVTIPGGTAVSSNGLNFVTNATVKLDEGNFSSGGNCRPSGDHVAAVGVTAQANGDQYNLGARSYSVSGQPNTVKAEGSDMSGGSSKIVKVVTQSDIDAAKAKLTANDETAKQQLRKALEDDGYRALTETFTTKDPATTISPELDQEGSEVTVSVKGTYTMIGVREDDLKQIVEAALQEDIDPSKQQVQDAGLGSARYTVTATEGNGDVKITMESQVAIGPKLDQTELKTDIAGKKRGESENVIKSIPGVKEVQVKYSPFWVSKTPKNQNKINIVIEKAE